MAPKSVSVTVRYSVPGTQPPIYLAGSFSDPAWEPQVMQYTTTESQEHEFYKEIQVEEGHVYQYKFRIGDGDWWMVDEQSATATDDAGNRNNLLSVSVSEEPKHDDPPAAETAAEMENRKPGAIEHEKSVEDTQSNGHVKEAESKGDSALPKEHNVITPAHTTTPVEIEKAQDTPAPKPIPYHMKENAEVRAGTPSEDYTVKAQDFEDKVALPAPDSALSREDIPSTEASLTPIFPGTIEAASTPAIEPKDLEETVAPRGADDTLSPKDIPSTEASLMPIFSGTVEPASTPATDSKSHEIPSPTLVVEKVDDELRHGDDFGLAATVGQKDAHHLRAQDALPDHIVMRSESKTPEIAENAYEVSESAALLDRDPPTPPISDEEAGRIGFRRMSSTPIPEVAKTAAEVADVAATLDEETPAIHVETAPDFRDDEEEDEDLLDSGASTPASQKAPRFAYECLSPDDVQPPADSRPTQRFDPLEPVHPQYEEIDWNDPSIEVFPTERSAILERLRRLSQRLPEDDSSSVDIVPPSPVVGPDGHPERQLPAPSPIVIAHENSPSLDSITEENDELQETLVSMPHISKLSSTGSERSSPGLHRGLKDTVVNGVEKPTFKGKEDENNVTAVAFDGANGSEETQADTKPKDVAKGERVPERFDENEKPTFSSSNEKSIELPQGSGVAELTLSKEQTEEIVIPERISSKVQEVVETPPPAVEEIINEQTRVPAPMTPYIVDKKQLGSSDDEIQEIETGSETPNITVQPATPGAAVAKTEFFLKPLDEAKSSAIEEENGRAQVISRKEARKGSPERPVTPSSVRSATREPKSRNFLKAFWQVLFVDWIGGFIRALCGGGRGGYTLVALGVIAFAVVAPTLFPGLFGESLNQGQERV